MPVNRNIARQIKTLLGDHPEGLSITDIVKIVPVNRNTASRYLDTLLISGQVEMRHFGMAKLYSLTRRLPAASVLSLSSDFVMQVDHSLRVIFVNAPFLQMLGLEEEAIVGRKIDFTPIPAFFEEDYTSLLRWIAEGLSGVPRSGEIRLATRHIIFATRVTPIVFPDGQKGVSVLFENITLQRRDEERLRDSEEKYRTIVETLTDGLVVSDNKGNVIEWNEAMTRIIGISREEALGTPFLEIIIRCLASRAPDPDRIAAITAMMRIALRMKSPRDFTGPRSIEILRPDGRRRIIRQTLFPLQFEGGIRIGSLVHDITEQTRADEFVRVLARMSDNAPASITIHDFEGNFLYANGETFRLHGYTAREFLAKKLDEIDVPESAELIAERMMHLQDTGSAEFDAEHFRKDGSRIPLHVNVKTMEWGSRTVVLSVATDMTERNRADAALRESEEKYRRIYNDAVIGLFKSTPDGRYISANPQAARNLGYESPEDLISSVTDIGTQVYADPEQRDEALSLLRQQGFIENFEARFFRKDGSIVWGSISAKAARDDKGNLVFEGSSRDISDRKEAEEALRHSEDRYRTLVEISPDAIILHRGGKIIYTNPAARKLLGASHPEEMLGKSIFDFIEPGARDAVRVNTRKDLEGVETPPMELQMLRRDGTSVIVEGRGVKTIIDGEPAIQVALRDITERKQAEEAIRASEERYRAVFENTGSASVLIDADTTIRLANAEFVRLSGYSKEEIEGKMSWTAFVVSEDLEQMLAQHAIRRQPGQNALSQYEFRFRRRSGEIRTIFLTVDMIPGTTHSITSLTDITEQKAAEAALKESEERYRRLLEQTFDAVIIHRDGVVTAANERAVQLMGASSPAQLIGRSIYDCVHTDSRPMVRARMTNLEEKMGRTLPLVRQTYLRLDGSPFEVEIMSTVFFEGGVPAVQTVFRNVSETVAMERALAQSEEQYRTLAESADDMIYITDCTGRLIYANTRCAQKYECAPGDLVGRAQEELFPPEIAQQHRTCIEEVIRTGRSLEHEESILTPDGSSIRIDIKLSPIRDADGRIVSIVGIARDITGRRK